MNNYGYFKYYDFANGIERIAKYTTSSPLQEKTNPQDIQNGIVPADYQSFEKGSYITDKPKELYKEGSLNFLTAKTSDENGVFFPAINLTIDFQGEYATMTGVNIKSRSALSQVQFKGYRDDVLILNSEILEGTKKSQFFDFVAEKVNKIVITISKIADANKFLGIWDVDFGKIRIFDDTTNIKGEIDKKFSLTGEELPFDVLNLNILENKDLLFQRKQMLSYFLNGLNQNFYIEQGTSNNDKTVNLMCYDDVSNLNSLFYGGIYENIRLTGILDKPLAGTGIEWAGGFQAEDNIELSGWLPICSRGETLKRILQTSRVRCFKRDILEINRIINAPRDYILNESNILSNPKPQIETSQPLKKLTLKIHRYSKKTEETELYHWYMSTTQPIIIEFSAPMHDLKAYEVTGTDENGNDIVDIAESSNVVFAKTNANYCIVTNSSSNKIVIKGQGYTDSVSEFVKENPLVSDTETHSEKVVELTLAPKSDDDCQKLLEFLYSIYSRTEKIKFVTLIDVWVGYNYNILGKKYTIISKKNLLNGTYEVEAV